jgi:hypothetical protein
MPDTSTIGGLMTGPEHYLEAERLIALARKEGEAENGAYNSGRHVAPPMILAEAQVHATLAAASAAAFGPDAEARAWASVAGTRLSDT